MTAARVLRAVWHDDAGTELVEYAFVASVLGVMMLAAVITIINSAGGELDATTTGWQNMAQTPP